MLHLFPVNGNLGSNRLSITWQRGDGLLSQALGICICKHGAIFYVMTKLQGDKIHVCTSCALSNITHQLPLKAFEALGPS